jgi:ADP-ribose pyrophosphatase YjhB (NUDIX family)
MANLIKARWVIKKGNTVFLVKDSRCHQFFLPWWTQEEWETIQECFYREIEEELWISPVMWDIIKIIETKNRYGHSSVEFRFEVLNIEDFHNIIKENCSHALEWTECGFYELDKITSTELRPNNLWEVLRNNNKIQLK